MRHGNDSESGWSRSRSSSKTRTKKEDEDIRIVLDFNNERSSKGKVVANGKRLFIGNLSPRTTDDGFKNFFKLFGTLTDCFLVYERGSQVSKCFGFVSFAKTSVAEKVLAEAEEAKLMLDGCRLKAELAVEDRKHTSREEEEERECESKVFVGKISPLTTDDCLKNYFRQFGPVSFSEIIKDGVTQESRGFGFVTFETKEDMKRALDEREHRLDGHTLAVTKAVPKYKMKRDREGRERSHSRGRRKRRHSRSRSSRGRGPYEAKKIFVRGLGSSKDEELLREVFEEFGEVTEAIIKVDAENKSRGFGFVTFAYAEGADKALSAPSVKMNRNRLLISPAKPQRVEVMHRERAYSPYGRGYSESRDKRYRERPIYVPRDHYEYVSSNAPLYERDIRDIRDVREMRDYSPRASRYLKESSRRGYGPERRPYSDHYERSSHTARRSSRGRSRSRESYRLSRHGERSSLHRYHPRPSGRRREAYYF